MMTVDGWRRSPFHPPAALGWPDVMFDDRGWRPLAAEHETGKADRVQELPRQPDGFSRARHTDVQGAP